MIRMIQITSAGHAEDYFSNSLSQTNYYINGQELSGIFKGRIAEKLNLPDLATKESFQAFCNNINPSTGEKLTQRTTENRTVYYDINFHVPKSVSIAMLINADKNILSAFQESVSETMRDIEEDAQTRIRKNGQNENRQTGELIWVEFTHLTARPVNDDTYPDPHLHCHCTTFNVTWDETEQQYKAGQFRDIKRDMPYYQERYYKRLADRLIDLGYAIRRTTTAFELENIPQPFIELFSKRTQEVNRLAEENNISDAEKLDQLGAQTRSKKKKDISINELKKDWNRQISELSLSGSVDGFKKSVTTKATLSITSQDCIDYAILQRFERASVSHDRHFLATAYRHSIGCADINLENITEAFRQDKRIIQIQDGKKLVCTTHEVLAEEQRMVKLAIAGKGTLKPLFTELPAISIAGDQAAAVIHILTSTDRVSNVQGGAGTGKTTTLKELVKHVHDAGVRPVMVAPTAAASRGVMREEGFAGADTVAKLQIDPDMQKELQNGMLIVDEAGLLGVKDMTALLNLVKDKNARLVLFGDTRQHASVVRGDALRILNTVAHIKAAEVNKIYRQRVECYRKAVEDLAAGNVQSAFDRLESFKAITEIEPENLNAQLVKDYMSAISNGKSALVVSPTHYQGELISVDIRNALKERNIIGQQDVNVTRYINLNYTKAEKSDPRMYESGFAIQFNQNLKGIVRGSIWQVGVVKENEVVIVDNKGKNLSLPLDKAEHFTAYKKTTIQLAIGDTISITRGSIDLKEKRLNNGQNLKVIATNHEELTLKNTANGIEYKVSTEFGHIRHGYTTTSHAAQGKTVDEVFIAQNSCTFAASNLKQFYVSVSRARDKVHIYTDDKAALMEQVTEIGNRQSAIELLKSDYLSQFINKHHTEHSLLYQPLLLQKSYPINSESRTKNYAPKPV